MALEINGLVKIRYDNSSNYATNDPVIKRGELAIENDTLKLKCGDGLTNWNKLEYVNGSDSGGESIGNGINSKKTNGIIIPLYLYPSDIYNNTTWGGVFDLARQNKSVPIIIIFNPDNGAGSVVDGNWTVAIKKSLGAGITPVGYVATSYGNKDIAVLKNELDNWKNLYPEIKGMFFDEMTYEDNQSYYDFYIEATQYAKSLGFITTIGNPGMPAAGRYKNIFDIVIEWETDAGWPTDEEMKGNWDEGATNYSLYNRGFLKIDESIWDVNKFEAVLPYYGWVYITDDTMSPNPWDSVSSYMSNMIASIKTS